jgi:hypothetical protein
VCLDSIHSFQIGAGCDSGITALRRQVPCRHMRVAPTVVVVAWCDNRKFRADALADSNIRL